MRRSCHSSGRGAAVVARRSLPPHPSHVRCPSKFHPRPRVSTSIDHSLHYTTRLRRVRPRPSVPPLSENAAFLIDSRGAETSYFRATALELLASSVCTHYCFHGPVSWKWRASSLQLAWLQAPWLFTSVRVALRWSGGAISPPPPPGEKFPVVADSRSQKDMVT